MTELELIKAAIEYMQQDLPYAVLSGIVGKDKIKGDWQTCECEHFDHEYVDQYCEYGECYYGNLYLPMPNGEYLCFEFRD